MDPEVDVGWISRVTVILTHGRRLIGEKTLRDTYMIPDEWDRATIRLESFEIKNMTAFKGFFEKLMPKNDIIQEYRAEVALKAALDDEENGHELSIAIDLSDVSKISVSRLEYNRCDDRIRLSFSTWSWTPFDIDFGCCQFVLEADDGILAFLDGRFGMGRELYKVALEGIVDPAIDEASFDGVGTLTGFKTYEHNNSFLAHAIRLFRIEVDLAALKGDLDED